MPDMCLIKDGEGAFPEAKELGTVTAMAYLKGGMQSGKGSVCFEFTDSEGTKRYAQTSVVLLETAAHAAHIWETE